MDDSYKAKLESGLIQCLKLFTILKDCIQQKLEEMMANPKCNVNKCYKLNCKKCFVCKKHNHGNKFDRKLVHGVLFDMFANNGGTIVGHRTIKNVSTKLFKRTKDCQSIWGLKTS